MSKNSNTIDPMLNQRQTTTTEFRFLAFCLLHVGIRNGRLCPWVKMASRNTYIDEDFMTERSEYLGILSVNVRQVLLRPYCDMEETNSALQVGAGKEGKGIFFRVSFMKNFDFVPVLSRRNFSLAGTYGR